MFLDDMLRSYTNKLISKYGNLERDYSLKKCELTVFARLDCVIFSLVIGLTSVSGPRNIGTLVHPHRG